MKSQSFACRLFNALRSQLGKAELEERDLSAVRPAMKRIRSVEFEFGEG